MRVRDKDRSPVGIHGCDAAPTPSGFAQIVSDDSSILQLRLHARARGMRRNLFVLAMESVLTWAWALPPEFFAPQTQFA
jgi:hypothetical protein